MLSYAVKLHCLKPAIWTNPAVSMEVRRRRSGRRTASWVSANKIWAQNKATSNTIRICTLSEDQSTYSQAETNRARETKVLGSTLGLPDATTWTRTQKAPGLEKRHSEPFFFPAGSFFFRSLRIQMYSIEGNKAISMQREFTV